LKATLCLWGAIDHVLDNIMRLTIPNEGPVLLLDQAVEYFVLADVI